MIAGKCELFFSFSFLHMRLHPAYGSQLATVRHGLVLAKEEVHFQLQVCSCHCSQQVDLWTQTVTDNKKCVDNSMIGFGISQCARLELQLYSSFDDLTECTSTPGTFHVNMPWSVIPWGPRLAFLLHTKVHAQISTGPPSLWYELLWKEKERFTLFSDHNESSQRRQPGANDAKMEGCYVWGCGALCQFSVLCSMLTVTLHLQQTRSTDLLPLLFFMPFCTHTLGCNSLWCSSLVWCSSLQHEVILHCQSLPTSIMTRQPPQTEAMKLLPLLCLTT